MKNLKFIALIALTLVVAGCTTFKAEKEAINSIKKLGDDLFFLEWTGDYGLDDFLAEGGAKDNEELATYLGEAFKKGKWTSPKNAEDSKIKITVPDFGCSSIVGKTENGHAIFGRNYDWAKDSVIMIVHTKPDNGYESISTSSMDFFGVQKGWEPTGSFREDLIALVSIYVALDGMNEKGLYVANLVAGDQEKIAQDTGKTALTATTALRVLLDKAATVDEAIALLESFDMHSSIGFAHHFAIADATGKSVAVEWVDGKMYVCETKILTNFYVADSRKKGVGVGGGNFRTLEYVGNSSNWIFTPEEVKTALWKINGNTRWSCVYEPANKKITYYIRENFNNPIIIEF